jgi:hypothetical protein
MRSKAPARLQSSAFVSTSTDLVFFDEQPFNLWEVPLPEG